jgi:FtsZ-interacting cell division protein YlmF
MCVRSDGRATSASKNVGRSRRGRHLSSSGEDYRSKPSKTASKNAAKSRHDRDSSSSSEDRHAKTRKSASKNSHRSSSSDSDTGDKHCRSQNRGKQEQTKGMKRDVRGISVSAKLGTYDGSSCLETFLAKFDNCTQYFKWKEEDKLFHLRASLEGAAGQILWTARKQTSVVEVIKILKNCFGNANQAERFRAELRAIKRRHEESLQSLYQDVCRLMSLVYAGQSNEMSDIVGRDSFLEALDNHSLRVRILYKEPRTLEDALNIASRLEAFDKISEVEMSDRE